MSELKLFFLGPPRVELDGSAVDIQRRKALTMLVYLAVSRRPHSRDALATLFYPDHSQSRARAYLRRDLAVLNTSLAGEWLDTDRETVELKSGFWVDVTRFRELVTECQQHGHPAEEVCPACVPLLKEAIGLYNDDFLAGFTLRDCPEFDDWQFFQAESLRQELATVLERLAQGLSDQGEPEAAIPYARRWIALDPLHEPAQRQLIKLYDLAGQPSAALRQYEEFIQLLDKELGLPPEKETTTLYEAVKAKKMLGPFLKAEERARIKHEEPINEVKPIPQSPTPAVNQAKEQQIRFCIAPDGVRIAYATIGQGPVLVRASNWLTHLEYDWESPVWRHWLMELSQHHTLVRYDRRGCGLSDWDVNDFSVQAYVEDLEAVVDTLGLERFPLFGISGGGPIAIAYAARHPERVSHLILYGSYARGRAKRSQNPEQLEEAQMMLKIMELGWGKPNPAFRQVYTNLFIPEGTTEQINWFNDLQRISTSPEVAVRMFSASYATDVSELARQVVAPTLVLHARNDAVTPFEEGRQLAALIPNARFVPLESKNHILLEHEPAWRRFLTEVNQFLQTEFGQPTLPAKSAPLSAPIQQPNQVKSLTSSHHLPPQPGLFVGREKELAQLEDWLDEVMTGQSRVGFVIGDAGQGKTSLLQAFSRRAQMVYPELIVVGGNCNAYTGLGDPYLPFREILALLTGDVEAGSRAGIVSLEQVQRIQRLLPSVMQAIAEVGPNLIGAFLIPDTLLQRASVYGPPGSESLTKLQKLMIRLSNPAYDANIQQAALFEQYTKLLQVIARQTPLLLILDDLQWADLGSINLLFHMGRRLRGFPILILGAYRPNDVAAGRLSERDGQREPHPLEPVINEFQRDFGRISLNLEEAEGRSFIDQLLDAEPNLLGADFRQTLYQQTNGHPLFSIELLRAMQERGNLVKDEAGCWIEQPGLDWTALPPRVEGAIGTRITRLEPALQKLLQIASVEGETFTAEVVAQVLQLDARTVIQQFSQVLDQIHHLVRPEGIKHDGELRLSRYRFRHILIQRYLYQNLDDIERTYHHEAVGRALETLYDQRVGQIVVQLAHHYSTAQIPEKARLYLDQAGDQARHSAALAEACRYYQAALALWPEREQADRARLLRKLGECQWVVGQLQDALTNLETCYSLNQALGNQKEAGATQFLIGRLYWEQGHREESLRYHQRALAILEELPESVELARAVSAISQMHMLAAEYEQATAWGERALALANRLRAEAVTAHTMAVLGDVYFYTGEQERGLAMLRDGLQLALSLGLPHEVCRAYLLLGESLASDGRYREAQTTFAELESYAARVGASLPAGSAVVESTKILWLTGDWQAALANRQKILDWDRQGQSLSYLQVIAGNLFGQIYNDLGRADQAWQVLQETVTQAKGQNELQTLGPHLAQSARALAGLGRESDSSAHLHQLLALIQRHPYDHVTSIMPLLFSCYWFAAQAANRDKALEDAKTSLQLLERLFKQTTSSVAKVALDEGRGIVAMAEGNQEEAVRHYQNGSNGWQSLGCRYDQLRALNGLAQALIHTNEMDRVRAAVAQGLEIIETLAAELDDSDTKAAFLNSSLVQQLHQAGSALEIQTASPKKSSPPDHE